MKKLATTLFSLALLAGLVAVLAVTAHCGSDGPELGPGGVNCEELTTEHQQLLNAPTNATVINKTPAHPPLENGELPQ